MRGCEVVFLASGFWWKPWGRLDSASRALWGDAHLVLQQGTLKIPTKEKSLAERHLSIRRKSPSHLNKRDGPDCRISSSTSGEGADCKQLNINHNSYPRAGGYKVLMYSFQGPVLYLLFNLRTSFYSWDLNTFLHFQNRVVTFVLMHFPTIKTDFNINGWTKTHRKDDPLEHSSQRLGRDPHWVAK